MAQWVVLPPHSSRDPDSILSLTYSLCGVSHVLLMSVWVSCGFLYHLSKMPLGGLTYSNFLLGVNVAVSMVPCDGLVSHPGETSSHIYGVPDPL